MGVGGLEVVDESLGWGQGKDGEMEESGASSGIQISPEHQNGSCLCPYSELLVSLFLIHAALQHSPTPTPPHPPTCK